MDWVSCSLQAGVCLADPAPKGLGLTQRGCFLPKPPLPALRRQLLENPVSRAQHPPGDWAPCAARLGGLALGRRMLQAPAPKRDAWLQAGRGGLHFPGPDAGLVSPGEKSLEEQRQRQMLQGLILSSPDLLCALGQITTCL